MPLTTWFLAFYLIGKAMTAISSLELSRHLGIKYDTAWLLHNKILRAMAAREVGYLLRGKIQLDDARLCGERNGGKVGGGSENRISIVAAVSLNEPGHLIHPKIKAVSGFSSEAIADSATNTWRLVARSLSQISTERQPLPQTPLALSGESLSVVLGSGPEWP